jgi:RimJ/RimL family protein N-acetyltransferase
MPLSRLDTAIETERLVLRVPSLREFDAWSKFMADEESARFIGKVQSPAAVWRGIATVAGSWVIAGYGMFSAFEKSSGRWIGRMGPWQPHGWPGTEVGWGVVREVWGQGYAFEASVASMNFAVNVLGWTDIIHTIHPDNVRSQNLAARLGSVNRGPGRLPDPFANDPVDVWGQTASQWKAGPLYTIG